MYTRTRNSYKDAGATTVVAGPGSMKFRLWDDLSPDASTPAYYAQSAPNAGVCAVRGS